MAALACAPERTTSDRVLRPVVSQTSVVTLPSSETSTVVVTRAENYIGESMGFNPQESTCVVAAMEEAGMKTSWLFSDAPSEEVHQQILRFMQECLTDPTTHTASPTSSSTPTLPQPTP